MPFTPTITMINTASVAQAQVDLLQGLAVEALNLWGASLAGSAAITVQIEITTAVPSGRADGTWGNGQTIGGGGGFTYASGGAAFELQGNTIAADSGPDIVIRFHPTYLLDELFLDPTPATRGDTPIDRTDGLSVMIHEIGHALGFTGYYDEAQNNFFANFQTPYDSRLAVIGGEAYFDGPNVQALMGGPVPLTNNNYTHYGNTNEYPGFTSDPLTGLMNGVVFYRGWNYAIGDLDLAIMADIGLGTVRDDILNLSYMASMRGGLGNDTITGGAGANLLQGDEGNDVVNGAAGADNLFGGDGNDILNGGSGNDVMDGGMGNDILYYSQIGDMLIEGVNGGTDEVRSAFNHTLCANFENLRLSGTATVGTGNAGDNSIFAGGGLTTLSGMDGNDSLYGGGNVDTMFAGNGNDTLFGKNGNDVLNGDAGDDILRGEVGSDTINGGAGNDTAFGGDGQDVIHGDDGNDVLRGEAQIDTLFGDGGADTLQGGDGNDVLYGGSGRDIVQGGAGSDSFWFVDGDFAGLTNGTADRIQDFVQGADRMRLNLIDANTLVAGDQAFSFIGAAAFSNIAGQLRYVQSAGVTLIEGDTNGDGTADFAIALTGTIAILGSDFTL
jgi:Ca2+-binding RTX toxin-like protein